CPSLPHDAPPPASPRSVSRTRIVEAVMSRRKHKHRTATPTVPTSPAAPDNRAGQPAPTDGVYHDSLPIRHRHAGGVHLGLGPHHLLCPTPPRRPPTSRPPPEAGRRAPTASRATATPPSPGRPPASTGTPSSPSPRSAPST